VPPLRDTSSRIVRPQAVDCNRGRPRIPSEFVVSQHGNWRSTASIRELPVW